MKAVWKQAQAIARKELGAYFGSPMAFIFVGVFLIVTLIVFFSAETFFANNVATVRPLFRWMPVLLIFLVTALTMRQWSEEQRSGTLEVLLTLPVRPAALVAGKFLAVMTLVVLALGLTIFLPITVSLLGQLDWGPVIGGYLAAILMAAAYTAIGLYISSRTDNQIVSLLLTALVGGAFYLVGTSGVTRFVGDTIGQLLRAIGTGSRFESIERGVIDLRDLVYYLSLAAFFMWLNVVSLDSKRWGHGSSNAGRRWNTVLRLVLVGANLLALNIWVFPLARLRADITAQHEYSLSATTLNLIRSLNEPMLMRGYFSQRTHPLLAPLTPTLRDIMTEYQVASNGKIKVEFVDPTSNPDAEAEANEVYGISPTSFRVAGRYEESVISSYFNILIRYGDQNVTLGFNDLIEVTPSGSGDYDVSLRNPEYDLTRSVKKVVSGFQSLDAVFAGMAKPVKLTAYITPKTLPADFEGMPGLIEQVARDIEKQSGGKFTYQQVDPTASNAPMSPQKLYEAYGLQPFTASLLSQDTFYMHLLLDNGQDKPAALYPTPGLTEGQIRSELESALRRAAPGFLKTVGVWNPSEEAMLNMYGQQSQPVSTWTMMRQQLGQNYTVTQVDLNTGRVPGDVDVLLIVAPKRFTDRARFAVDQYLMRGGAVIVALSNYMLASQQLGGGIMMEPLEEGLAEMLDYYGVKLEPGMVMDPQNEPFPMQVPRKVGNITIQELRQISYPFFVDVRDDGMNKQSPIVAGLSSVTLQWASPLSVDTAKNEGRKVTELLHSTKSSWLRTTSSVDPDLEKYPQLGFPVEGEQKSHLLAVSIRGVFTSYFKDNPSPFQQAPASAGPTPTPDPNAVPTPKSPVMGTVQTSPDTARLVVLGSAEFIDDTVLQISQSASTERYLNNLQLLQNTVDWSVEDEDLLTIRSRGASARLLRPLSTAQQSFWEGLNYVLALAGLLVIGLVWRGRRRREAPMILLDAKREPVKGSDKR